MIKINCKKYEDKVDFNKSCKEVYWDWTIEEKECNYCYSKETIEWKLNDFIEPIRLDYFVSFVYSKLDLQWKDIQNLEDKDILPESLDLIWELLKEKKVKAQIYEIEEYEEPKEEEIIFWTKFKKTLKKDFEYKISRLDPCIYKDNEKLEEDIENWKIETLALYKYVLKKYGQDEANFLFDILEIVRSKCYKWEIEIE